MSPRTHDRVKSLTARRGGVFTILPGLLLAAVGAVLLACLGEGWVHWLAYLLVAVLASPSFCLCALLIHAVTVPFPTVFIYPVTCADAGVAVLALVWLWAGRLGREDGRPAAPITLFHRLARPSIACAYAMLLCWTLLRDTSVVQGLSLIWIVALVHRANPSLHAPLRPFLGSGMMVNLAVLAVSVVCAALLLEGGARLAFGPPKGDDALWIPDSEYLFLLNPGAEATQTVPLSAKQERKITYRISRQGFRDREFPDKAPGETRILLLGDSFTMGHAVGQDNTIAKKLARLYRPHGPGRISVINGGMNGAGPLQELGMLERRGLALKPDCVVLQLFLLNDFDDCLMTVDKAQQTFFEYFHEIVNNLRRANVFPERQEYLLRIHSAAYYQLECATAFKPWAARFLSAWRFAPAAPVSDVALFADAPEFSPIVDVNRTDWYPDLCEGVDLLVDYVERMHTLCAQRNVPFAVYCTPEYHELGDDAWALLSQGTRGQFASERYRAIKIVEKRLGEKGITTFSVTDALEHQAASLGMGKLYYLLDGHLTPKGNEVIAGRIHEFLVAADLCR